MMGMGEHCCNDSTRLLVSSSEPSSAMIISVGRTVWSSTESTDNSSASFQLNVVIMSDVFIVIPSLQSIFLV